MTQATLQSVLASLEEEIRLLRHSLRRRHSIPRQKNFKGFSSLRGLWKGKVSFSIEDIRRAEIGERSF